MATLPWSPRERRAAMPAEGDDVNDAAARGLAQAAGIMAARARADFPHLKPILVAHWAVSGRRSRRDWTRRCCASR